MSSMEHYYSSLETEKFGIRKGCVFYFGDWIDYEKISILESIIEQFLLITNAKFTKKRGGNDYANIRNIRGRWQKVFHKEFDCKDFNNAQVLTLDSCTLQNLQLVRAVIQLSNSNPTSMFNKIYFQFPIQTEWSILYKFIEYVNSQLNLYYASAGYEMASNILYYPGSVGQSVRMLKNLKYVNSEYTEWGTQYDIKARLGIPCPNFIQLLHFDLYSKIRSEEIIGLNRNIIENKLILDILDRTKYDLCEPTFENIKLRYAKLYELLKPIIILYDRPVYLEKDDWIQRINRFEIDIK